MPQLTPEIIDGVNERLYDLKNGSVEIMVRDGRMIALRKKTSDLIISPDKRSDKRYKTTTK